MNARAVAFDLRLRFENALNQRGSTRRAYGGIVVLNVMLLTGERPVAKKSKQSGRLPKAPLAEVVFELRWNCRPGL